MSDIERAIAELEKIKQEYENQFEYCFTVTSRAILSIRYDSIETAIQRLKSLHSGP